MKLNAAMLFLLTTVGSAMAVILIPFTNWDDLTKKSPDIVIARCSATTSENMPVGDGMNWSDIEVEFVLKGSTKPGTARMVSQYLPHQGERFMMFAEYQSNYLYQAYNATETYRVVPLNRYLGRYFETNDLAGKSLDEQIQIVLRHRLEDVRRELEQHEEEKVRLESGLK